MYDSRVVCNQDSDMNADKLKVPREGTYSIFISVPPPYQAVILRFEELMPVADSIDLKNKFELDWRRLRSGPHLFWIEYQNSTWSRFLIHPCVVEGAHNFLGNSASTDLIRQTKRELGQVLVLTPTLETIRIKMQMQFHKGTDPIVESWWC